MRHLPAVAADENALKRRAVVQMLQQPLEPVSINDGDLGAGIVEAVLQLRPGPPGIEQGRDTACEQAAKESGRPFRQIAHSDGDAVAFLDTGLLQGLGDGKRGAGKRLVARAFVAIDDEGLAAVRVCQEKQVAHGRRRVFPHARAHAANVALFHLEGRAGTRQRGVGLRQRNGRETLCCRQDALSSARL